MDLTFWSAQIQNYFWNYESVPRCGRNPWPFMRDKLNPRPLGSSRGSTRLSQRQQISNKLQNIRPYLTLTISDSSHRRHYRSTVPSSRNLYLCYAESKTFQENGQHSFENVNSLTVLQSPVTLVISELNCDVVVHFAVWLLPTQFYFYR